MEQHPKLQEYQHRPVGMSVAREIKSQKAQLNSCHRHQTNKNLKIGMTYKIGLRKEDKKD